MGKNKMSNPSIVQKMDKQKLRKFNGGIPWWAFAGIAIGAISAWITVCDKVEEIGQEIGTALSK